MPPSRRLFMQLAAGAVVQTAGFLAARAQGYPTRPVRLLVGVAAGGTLDIFARLIGQWLSQRFGQPFVVENRPGAGTNIATELVVHAPPDGYTLLLVAPPNAINATLYKGLSFNFLEDISPVGTIGRVPLVIVVHPSVPAETLPEFLAYAKSNPGKVNMASGGKGTTPHVAGELFNMTAGINMVHVPYRGAGPAMADLLGGQVHVLFAGTPESMEHINSGRLRALAVTDPTRLKALPHIPCINEYVPGYEAISFTGIGAPRNTPQPLIDALNDQINAGLTDQKIRERIAALGGAPFSTSPATFRRFLAEETEKWGRVVRAAELKPD